MMVGKSRFFVSYLLLPSTTSAFRIPWGNRQRSTVGPFPSLPDKHSTDVAACDEIHELDDDLLWDLPSTVQTWLVCGDGDLSYSSRVLAPACSDSGVVLTATVWETQPQHARTYRHSQRHTDLIRAANGTVRFGVDATKLAEHFPSTRFDRIQFNFPHWRGKSNHRYNRQLVWEFFQSARACLAEGGGQIWVALTKVQGGAHASTWDEWNADSWKVLEYANEAGLLLTAIQPFANTVARYHKSSHRGVDRPFATPEPYLYKFEVGIAEQGEHQEGEKEDAEHERRDKILPEYQLCCRHELHLVVEDADRQLDPDYVLNLARTVVPDGIEVLVPWQHPVANTATMLYQIVYCGSSRSLTRTDADTYREKLEEAVEREPGVSLRENRRGRLVSKPFPYSLFVSVMESK